MREKIIAAASRKFVVVADDSKRVSQLGKFPLPLEVIRFGWEMTIRKIQQLGCKAAVRSRQDSPFITDNGNYIVDCHFEKITDPSALNDQLRGIPGIVETGLFIGMASKAVIGYADGSTRVF